MIRKHNPLRNRIRILFACLMICLSGCKEQIVHNLLESEANRLLTGLHQNKIEAHKVRQPDGRWLLEVDSDESIRAIKFLDDSRMLKDLSPSSMDKGSMVSSQEEQRFRHERSLSHEIEMTLSSLDQVLEARVHLNLPPLDPLFGQPLGSKEGSGSVLIITREGFSLEREEVARLVAGAAGIQAQSIAVLISQAKASAEDAAQKNAAIKQESSQVAEATTQVVSTESGQQSAPLFSNSIGLTGAVPWILSTAILLILLGVTLLINRRRRQHADQRADWTGESSMLGSPALHGGGQ